MMRKSVLGAGVVWALAVAVLLGVEAAGRAHELLHTYFAAWLVLISLPLGALPLIMCCKATDARSSPEARALELLLAGLPLLALLIVPVLIELRQAYAWVPGSPLQASGSYAHFGAQWFTRGGFTVRAIIYLAVWTVLAMIFLPRASRLPSRGLAAPGLVLHLGIGTLAAFDWFMSLDAGFTSACYGVLVISAQAAFAWTVAMAISLAGDRAAPSGTSIAALLALVLAAAFVQFSQYLIIWSANLPKEVIWYQTRGSDPAGPSLAVAIPLLLAFGLMLVATFARTRPLVICGLSCLMLAEVLDLVCLASPRDTFNIVAIIVDLAMIVAVGGIVAAGALLVGTRLVPEPRHG